MSIPLLDPLEVLQKVVEQMGRHIADQYGKILQLETQVARLSAQQRMPFWMDVAEATTPVYITKGTKITGTMGGNPNNARVLRGQQVV